MLNRIKLAVALENVVGSLFVDYSDLYTHISDVWKRMIQDRLFLKNVLESYDANLPTPGWLGNIDALFFVEPYKNHYTALAVDGSQIYPDRHQPVNCFLINIGLVRISYDLSVKPVAFVSEPTIIPIANALQSCQEYVNAKRHDLELSCGFTWAQEQQSKQQGPSWMLLDGSLIFWHLEAKEGLKDLFFEHYCNYLMQFWHNRLPVASYISAPKSKELISLVRLYNIHSNGEMYEGSENVTDAALLLHILPPFHRTTIFLNRSSISFQYQDSIRPCFFYMHVGDEIGRVELPWWIAQDQELVNELAAIILDQSMKGGGYPIVLAEAHEQAVVKGADRDFFYHCLAKKAIESTYHVPLISRKKLRKLYLGF